MKKSLRQIVKEMIANPEIGWQSTGDLSTAPVGVSAVVDSSAAVTDPYDDKFVPRNRMELTAAMPVVIDSIADDDVPSFYAAVKDIVSKLKNEEEDMRDSKQKKVEEIVRKQIRSYIREAAGSHRDSGISFSGYASSEYTDEEAIAKIVKRFLDKYEVTDAATDTGAAAALKDLIYKITFLPGDREKNTFAAIEMIEETDDIFAERLRDYLRAHKDMIPRKYEKGSEALKKTGEAVGVGASGVEKITDTSTKKMMSRFLLDPSEEGIDSYMGIDPNVDIISYTAVEDFLDVIENQSSRVFGISDFFDKKDIQFLKSDPEAVRELKSFQVFLQPYLAAMQDIIENPNNTSLRNRVKEKAINSLKKESQYFIEQDPQAELAVDFK